MSDTDEPKFLNTREVCAYLRLKERTVYELVRTRQIPTMRVAGKWLFPKALIDRWLEENTDASPLAAKGAVTPAIVAGSHDPLLDWAVRESGCGLALLCQGSEDGLRRIDERSAMLAAVHLLDPATGEYNVAEFERLAHRGSLVLTEWARRRQGLVLAPGLGARVATIADLVRGGLRVVQRQEGSGSRRLFDHLLAGAGVDAAALRVVDGCARSETEVAEAIAEGRADASLAIESVARAHRLDFMPLQDERVDLILRRFDWFEPPVQALLRFCSGDAFRRRAATMAGYDASGCGRVIRNG